MRGSISASILCVGDYYAAGQTVAGEWFGVGAEKLGMKGKVGERAFLALKGRQITSSV